MSRKDKRQKGIRASISVLLVIILLPMMTFSALIVDICRINMAKQMMSSAGDLTMNTALANYDTILKDVYGLFAMSQAEGMDNDQLGQELNAYFAKTLSAYGVVDEENAEDYVSELIGDFRDLLNGGTMDTTNFLQMDDISLTVTTPSGSSLANADVLRKQIVEYMKYRAPLGVGISFLESLSCFQKLDAQNEVVEAQVVAQESTQDVTKACKTLIEMIREYDEKIEQINESLKGVSSSSDSTAVPLEAYDTQANKYGTTWGENYKRINRLTLVFLANTPSISDLYLSSLSDDYIDDYGKLSSGTTGIRVTVPTLAADSGSAKAQVEEQITNLTDNYSSYASMYTQLLDPSLLTTSSNNYNNATISTGNETNAINAFVKFEQFLLDQAENGSVTYSQMKSLLEQIYILDKYLANYETKIDADINAAQTAVATATSQLNSANSNKSAASATMSSSVTNINDTIQAFMDGHSDVANALEAAGVRYSYVSSIEPVLSALPAWTEEQYEVYYSDNIKDGSWDKFARWFQWLLYSSSIGSDGTADQQKILEEAKKYVSEQGYDAAGFRSYMEGKLTAEKEDILFDLLCCLMDCHASAIAYQDGITSYEDAVAAVAQAESEKTEAENRKQSLNSQKNNVKNSVTSCLQQFHSIVHGYQQDLGYYETFINAAKNTVTKEAAAIQTQASALVTNIEVLRAALEAIDNQVGVVKTAIAAYNESLDEWEEAKDTYETNNGGDSFSSQSSTDIEKARTDYDESLYDTLDSFIIQIWNEYDDFYSSLTADGSFTYGATRITEIGSADQLTAAISGTRSSLSQVVTKEEADGLFGSLYTGYIGDVPEFVPYTINQSGSSSQLGFLTPAVVPLQALKYLNTAYPKSEEEDQEVVDDYDSAKEALTKNTSYSGTSDESGSGGSEGGEDSGEGTGSFGYTYSSYDSLPDSSNLPSKLNGATSKQVEDSTFTLEESESDDTINASNSVSAQSDTTSTALDGIGSIATTAVENLYILDYIFENFSYNTIVQEQIAKDNDADLKDQAVVSQIFQMQGFQTEENIAKAKTETTTLSNFAINEDNNYLYGAEIEYILFGNANPSTNVTYAKASIYAIRFGFNCIFAFTNSEIRNTTMAAGLAVQAATLGIVPYQVVQIVLQLALAAAESAIDLSALSCGLSVAVVKTSDTWALSVSGATDVAKDAITSVAKSAADFAADQIEAGINGVTTGLNDLLDAGADELKDSIEGLSNTMTNAAKGVLESVADSVQSAITAKIECVLNNLQVSDKKSELQGNVQDAFNEIRGEIETIVADACGDNAMAQTLAGVLAEKANEYVNSMEREILNTLNKAPDENDVTAFVTEKISELRMTLLNEASDFIDSLSDSIYSTVEDALDETTKSLQEYISQCGEDLSEEAAEAIKQEVSSLTDDFVDTTLNLSGSTAAADVKTSAVSMFKFNYRQYLMLLVYISICCGDSVLLRTADVIQMNLQSGNANAQFSHKANSDSSKFRMSQAYTYISISATAKLDMFFMDLSIFASQVESAGDGTADSASGGFPIAYTGILGY